PVEIYDVRADLLALFPGATAQNDDSPPKWSHPFRAGKIIASGKTVAQFAELHPAIAKKFGIKTKVVIGLVDDASVIPEQEIAQNSTLSTQNSTNDFPDFPLITRDFAFIVDNKVSPEDITAAIATANPIVYETNVFDVFDMGNGQKSVAFELVLQPASNMSDADLTEFQAKIIAEVEGKFAAKIRSQ
ncbi:MAG: hypothetical protein FWE17_00070, partial [Alphaproteobacteria bacterium]|nr:hypothetical protein [Alphaproteobacteria bacterium]